jgi:hypothetical protein
VRERTYITTFLSAHIVTRGYQWFTYLCTTNKSCINEISITVFFLSNEISGYRLKTGILVPVRKKKTLELVESGLQTWYENTQVLDLSPDEDSIFLYVYKCIYNKILVIVNHGGLGFGFTLLPLLLLFFCYRHHSAAHLMVQTDKMVQTCKHVQWLS